MAPDACGQYETEFGRVSIAAEIIQRFVVEELDRSKNFRLASSRADGGFFGRKGAGIRLEFVEGCVDITVPVQVRFDTKIWREAQVLRGKIVRAITAGTGLSVHRIAVNVYQIFEETAGAPPVLPEPTPPEAAVLEPVEV